MNQITVNWVYWLINLPVSNHPVNWPERIKHGLTGGYVVRDVCIDWAWSQLFHSSYRQPQATTCQIQKQHACYTLLFFGLDLPNKSRSRSLPQRRTQLVEENSRPGSERQRPIYGLCWTFIAVQLKSWDWPEHNETGPILGIILPCLHSTHRVDYLEPAVPVFVEPSCFVCAPGVKIYLVAIVMSLFKNLHAPERTVFQAKRVRDTFVDDISHAWVEPWQLQNLVWKIFCRFASCERNGEWSTFTLTLKNLG